MRLSTPAAILISGLLIAVAIYFSVRDGAGRYQLAADTEKFVRLDTYTGEIVVCPLNLREEPSSDGAIPRTFTYSPKCDNIIRLGM